MNSYMVWVTKISYAQVAVGVKAENEEEARDEAIKLASTREDFLESEKVKYETNSVFKHE